MIPFLKQIAKAVVHDHELSKKTIIFPNLRAPLFFQKYLSEYLRKPAWAPRLISIEHFFLSLSPLHEANHVTLIYEIYKTYQKIMYTKEPFYRFYFWGNMILRDFNEIDKSMVNATQMFRDLSNLKELDESFDLMSEEQREFLKIFWKNINDKPTKSKEEFLKIWKKFPEIYTHYRETLKKNKLGYEGMIHRQVIEDLDVENLDQVHLIFVGFNALTKVEEKLICYYVERGAKVYWDTDAYYMNTPQQEAGLFLRDYQKHPTLSKTFVTPPSNIKDSNKKITIMGAPHRIGQSRMAGQKIEAHLSSETPLEQTVVVLPDESMLLPMLHALPPALTAVNVTIGYPLQQTLLYTLLDLAIALQRTRKKNYFHHRQVIALLTHAYVLAIEKKSVQKTHDEIIDKNKIFISPEDIHKENPLSQLLFQIVDAKEALTYLLNLVDGLSALFTDTQDFDRQCAFHLHQHLSSLHKILSSDTLPCDWKEFQELFHQTVLAQKTPFTGEPLNGMQVMGMLETRNLDFENVHILSLNEGILPMSARQNSYIPFHVRKAYQMPTRDRQDAMYAYLFYRLLQRAKHIWLYYSTETGPIGNGEMSRYVKQLLYESDIPITRHFLHNPVTSPTLEPIVVHKTKAIQTLLGKYQIEKQNSTRELTPSALNDYLDCRLRFYLKHIARLREPEKVEENPDARIFGNILHDAVHIFYTALVEHHGNTIEKKTLDKTDALMNQSIDKAFAKQYPNGQGKPPTYKGQHCVVRSIIGEWMMKIIECDKKYAPFTLVALEKNFNTTFSLDHNLVALGGKIDRVDRKDNALRIIDYKTGGDELAIADIPSLFLRNCKRNKAAFQTMLYAYLYFKKEYKNGERIIPGLMNRKNLFAPNFTFGHFLGTGKNKSQIEDVAPHFEVFEEHLRIVLADLYDFSISFDQTDYTKNCVFCPYRYLCNR